MTLRCWLGLSALFWLVACSPRHKPNTPVQTGGPPVSAIPATPTNQPQTSAAYLDDWQQAMLPTYASDVDAAIAAGASRYVLQLTVDPSIPKLDGVQTIHYNNTQDHPLDTIYLRLYPNDLGLGQISTVSEVTAQLGSADAHSRPIEPIVESKGSVLRLPLPAPLAPDQSLTLTLHFTLTLPGQVIAEHLPWSLGPDLLALPYTLPTIPVYDDAGWHITIPPPHSDRTHTDIALYRVEFSAPAGATLITSGICLNKDQASPQTCVSGPMRDFIFILSSSYAVVSQTVQGVTINSYYPPQVEWSGKKALEFAAGAVKVYSQRFGAYPYTELDVVAAKLPVAGLEFPGLVLIAPELYDQHPLRSFEWVIAHEVGHQWWYGLVGSDQINEPWLDEALTEYSTLLYIQDTYGIKEAASELDRLFIDPYERIIENHDDMPVGLPAMAYPERLYGAIVYRKGALFFDVLRQEMGDPAFTALLQAYFKQHRYKIASAESFMDLAESLGGPNVRPLCEQWIQGSIRP